MKFIKVFHDVHSESPLTMSTRFAVLSCHNGTNLKCVTHSSYRIKHLYFNYVTLH